MAALINRNPNGRMICLHALTKTLNSKFGQSDEFSINDLKYDENSHMNITDFCEILVKPSSVKQKVCPYLDNPLSKAKCYLTQSIQHDTQKSKSASDAMNALDGLGFVRRGKEKAKLTKTGITFANTDFKSPNWLTLAKEAVLGYGPFIGLLFEIKQKSMKRVIEISKSQISLAYPQTREKISYEGKLIELSTGSQDDTITRTRAVLFSWAVSTGFAIPKNMQKPSDENVWHIHTRDYVEQEKWHSSAYTFFIPNNLFNGKHFVNRPLNYTWMTKSTKALRERGQDLIRKASLEYESTIKNRRFAIVYSLAYAAHMDKRISFIKLLSFLKNEKTLFVINPSDFENVMINESKIAAVCGIPFFAETNILKPLTKINMDILKEGAPVELIQKLEYISPKCLI